MSVLFCSAVLGVVYLVWTYWHQLTKRKHEKERALKALTKAMDVDDDQDVEGFLEERYEIQLKEELPRSIIGLELPARNMYVGGEEKPAWQKGKWPRIVSFIAPRWSFFYVPPV